jgi:hypothetical protein
MNSGKAEVFRPGTGNNLNRSIDVDSTPVQHEQDFVRMWQMIPNPVFNGISENACKFPNRNPKRWRKRHYLITLKFCVAQRICSLVSDELLEALWNTDEDPGSLTPTEPPQNASMQVCTRCIAPNILTLTTSQ